MKYINKGPEPNSLREFRKNLTSDDYKRKTIFDEYPKKDLKKFLLEEQGYICCYCMQRIDEDNMKIEHWRSQSCYPQLKFDYQNLLAACKGNEGDSPKEQHCDTRKGFYEQEYQRKHGIEYKMTIKPTDKNCERYFKYCSTGEIDFSELDLSIREDLEKALNLNQEILVKKRKQTLKAVISKLNRISKQPHWSDANIKKKIKEYETKTAGKYKTYCQMVIYWLNKRLAKKLGSG